MPASPGMELESLFVRIWADSTQFVKTLGNIRTQVNSLHSFLSRVKFALPEFSVGNLSLLGFLGASTSAFARLDDALARATAHMQDWNNVNENRRTLERAVLDISEASSTSVVNLAKGLDVLVSAGYNAAAAARALGVAETFSVASGMDMEAATQRLVNIQRTMGLMTNDVAQNISTMNRLSDLFTHIAPMVGSSVDQLTAAFGSRFVNALTLTNQSLEQGMALQAVYSLRNIRGSDASDRAARALIELGRRSTENIWRWRQLGIEVYTSSGQMRKISEIIRDLDRVLGNATPQVAAARLQLMGLEQRAIHSIVPLLGMSDAWTMLLDEEGKAAGTTKKMADLIRGDFLQQLRLTWNSITNLGMAFVKYLAPAMAMINDGIRSLIHWFQGLNPAVQSLIVYSLLLSVALMPVLRLMRSLLSLALAPFLIAFSMIWKTVAFTLGIIFGLLSKIAGLLKTVIYGAFSLIKSAVSSIVSFIASIPSMLISIIPALISLVVNFIAWSVALATVVTLLMGIPALLGGVVSLVGGLFEKLHDSWEDIRDAGIHAFGGVQDAALGFFEGLGDFILKLAGFFYNFEENMGILIPWLRRNWRELVNDIGEGFAVAFRNIAHNISVLAAYIWDHLSGTFQRVKFWIGFNWEAMTSNLQMIFSTFGSNLLENWKTIVGAMVDILISYMTGPRIQTFWLQYRRQWAVIFHQDDLVALLDRQIEELRNAPATQSNNIIRNALGQLRSPLQGMEALQSMTSYDALMGFLTTQSTEMRRSRDLNQSHRRGIPLPSIFGLRLDAVESLLSAGSSSMGGLRGIFDGFASSIREALHLNLQLPPDPVGSIIAAMNRFFRPESAPGESEGAVVGRQGPGFGFKQISLQRTMLGGPAAELMDYQQLVVLRSINDRLGTLIGISRGMLPDVGMSAVPLIGP